MNSPIDRALGGFLDWWGSELKALAPGPFRRALFPEAKTLELCFDGGGVDIALESDGLRRPLGFVALDRPQDGDPLAEMRKLIGRRAADVDSVVARLPAGRVLDAEMEVPAAAAAQLREVVARDMDRVTPFRADEVFFDWRVSDSDLDAERLTVRLRAARRADAEAALALTRAAGLIADRLDGPEGEPFNLIPPDARPRARRVLPTLVAAAAFALAASVAAALWLTLQQQSGMIALLEARADDLGRRAAAVRAIEDQADAMLAAAQALTARKTAQPIFARVVNEAAARAPDGSWFFELTLREDGLVQLSGYSDASPELLRSLGQSPIFAEARFSAPLIADARSGAERFTILVTLADRAEGE